MTGDLSTMLTGIGTLLTGIGTLGTAVWTRRVHRTTRKVETAVTTTNGHTLGELVEATHDEVATPAGVERLAAVDRARGLDPDETAAAG